MYLIIGLGNPEKDYANTRHNMGVDVINKLAKQYDLEIAKKKFESEYETAIIEGEKVVLIKPQTFMNSSGEAVKAFIQFYKVDLKNVIVIYDDIDIEVGKIKVRKSGSPGSHNGIKSVTHFLSDENFPRIRIGIGKPDEDVDLVEHVLGAIPDEERKLLDEAIEKAKNAIVELLQNGIDSAMNKYN